MLNRWTNQPVSVTQLESGGILVAATPKSDAWLKTYYGFEADTENAWLCPWDESAGFQVSFILDFEEQFDQAGIFIHADANHWIKAGVEWADGEPQLGAVVTHHHSDWSVAPVPNWQGQEVTIRATRKDDAVVIRARCGDEPELPIRVAYMDPGVPLEIGLFCASPSRGGLKVTFTGWGTANAEEGLH